MSSHGLPVWQSVVYSLCVTYDSTLSTNPNIPLCFLIIQRGIPLMELTNESLTFVAAKDSLPPTSDLPLVSPFLCSDDSEADGESEPAEQRPVSSSHDTLASLSEFPLALVVAHPRFVDGQRFLSDPLDLFPARRLAWRRVSHHSPDRHYSPDSSSSSSPSDHSLSGHTPPDTTDADSSTPQRFVHRSLARTP
ncbi:hypothetical protein Tco_0527986 [Tanacetum coccineum]